MHLCFWWWWCIFFSCFLCPDTDFQGCICYLDLNPDLAWTQTPHPLGSRIRGWRTHCCLTCLPTWPTSHPIEQSVARTHPWRNYLFGRHPWNHEWWERNWQNDEQVAAVDVVQPRWHYARFRSRLAQYYPIHRIPQLVQLSIELRLLQDILPAASSPNRLHIELTEWTRGRATAQLLPPVKGSVQNGVLSFFFIAEVIKHVVHIRSTVCHSWWNMHWPQRWFELFRTRGWLL